MANDLLAHARVSAPGAEPGSWLYVLHGIFGAGRNWASVARRIVRARPDWGALLIDLRQHGASQGFAPPHTVAAAAADLARLAESVAPAAAVLGHSFGGKVALAYAAAAPAGLRQVWVVDSTPAAREPAGSAWRMLEVVEALPDAFASRDELIAALERAGFARPVAQWMATNLEHRDGVLRWRFDLDAMRQLMLDFFRTDLWRVLEQPPPGVDIHIVKASESSVLGPEAVRRIERLRDGVRLHHVDGGHWLNADNPEALVERIAQALPRG
jgi:pimeloyl-ACP methyl ester carboxylesterase